MKLKEKTRIYCPYCKKHTLHKVSQLKPGAKRGSLKKGSLLRAKRRGLGRGYGNLGKYGSRPAVGKFKRTIKSSKKVSLIFTCLECKKKHTGKIPKRIKRIEIK
ncbi:50S ribosomal protein L44e [Candidatus Pacearchaeota archaeon ex4484_26]|nr:MAG: 50S ribosomal protein L44e [Candidatus Pacearchaeota archaeon ex4484_26]